MLTMPRRVEPPRSLLAVRHELEEIDRALVFLVAARVEKAAIAIRIRSDRDGPVSDPAQEEVVLARARGWAGKAGIPSDLVETIFRAMLGAGKEHFAASRDPPSSGAPTARPRGSARNRRTADARTGENVAARPAAAVPT